MPDDFTQSSKEDRALRPKGLKNYPPSGEQCFIESRCFNCIFADLFVYFSSLCSVNIVMSTLVLESTLEKLLMVRKVLPSPLNLQVPRL